MKFWDKIKSLFESIFESAGPTSLGFAQGKMKYDWSGRVRFFTSSSDGEVWINKADLIQLINQQMATRKTRLPYILNRIKSIGQK